MNVGIVINEKKQDAAAYYAKLAEAFRARGVTVFIAGKNDISGEVYESSDVIISIGGDGTFLRVAGRALLNNIPVLGFNLGTIGFLTEFDKGSIDSTVDRICRGDYTVEERNVLDVSLVRENEKRFIGLAVNDAVVTRDVEANTCHLAVHINGAYVATYTGDGIIVATQTGSTAYSLSAGGPIIEPGNDVLLITPICSQKMGSRTIVARQNSSISVKPVSKSKKVRLIIDGHISEKVEPGDEVICESSGKKMKILRIDPPNFYSAVAGKLFGESRNTED
ncbi:MAG: NAD(+)/NADH kinase [Clostridia bacterium]|nr:NAD(+)/NADH kinase [Clostridia bacterium]